MGSYVFVDEQCRSMSKRALSCYHSLACHMRTPNYVKPGKKKRKEKSDTRPWCFDPNFFIARRLHPFIKGGFVVECSLLNFPFIIVLLELFIFLAFFVC